MLRIVGRTSSINVRKVLWTVEELGLPFGQDFADIAHGPPGTTPDIYALNPNGFVPVIEDENGVLWESNTICRYLAGKHGRTDLLPTEPFARAQVERWMDWQATDLNSAWRYPFLALIRKDPAFTDKSEIERGMAGAIDKVRVVEGQLKATGAYMAGSAFTLADVLIGLALNRYFSLPADKPEMPAVDAYIARLGQREGFRKYGGPANP